MDYSPEIEKIFEEVLRASETSIADPALTLIPSWPVGKPSRRCIGLKIRSIQELTGYKIISIGKVKVALSKDQQLFFRNRRLRMDDSLGLVFESKSVSDIGGEGLAE